VKGAHYCSTVSIRETRPSEMAQGVTLMEKYVSIKVRVFLSKVVGCGGETCPQV